MSSGPAWKREIVPDHKFDFIDTREFYRQWVPHAPELFQDNPERSLMFFQRYLWLYIIILKSFLVYLSDIFTATTMLTTSTWSNQIFNDCQNQDGCFYIPFNVGKWLFVGCIIFGFLLLAYEARKSKKIIASRDISYAFTNVMANHYYSLRSYDHFCFFDHISNSTKKKDDFAFFIFFTFKSWKRLLLSDGPRQTINALTLYSIYLAKNDKGSWYDISKYFAGNSLSTSALTVSTFFTFVIFAGSLLLLIMAGIFYIPLLCYIQGNLKEYVCHKVDKRIAEVIKRRNKERLAKAAALAKKEAMGDFSHLKNKKGEIVGKPLPQPTLPNLSVDDDDDARSISKRGPGGTYNQDYYYDQKSIAPSYHTNPAGADYTDYPPMPAHNAGYSHQTAGTFNQYIPSSENYEPQHQGYEEEYGSTVHLQEGATLAYQSNDQGPYDSYGSSGAPGQYVANAHDVYQGRANPGAHLPYNGASRQAYDVEDYPSQQYTHAHNYDYTAAIGDGYHYQGMLHTAHMSMGHAL